jgi:hypothetical protein
LSTISENTEVRWDTFEESMLIYLETKLDLDKEVIARVNWKKFLAMLKVRVLRGISKAKMDLGKNINKCQ